jgi:site-specific recombinase
MNIESELRLRAFLRNGLMAREFDEVLSKHHEHLRTASLVARADAKAQFEKDALEDTDLHEAAASTLQELLTFQDMNEVYIALVDFAREHFDREICPGGALINP